MQNPGEHPSKPVRVNVLTPERWRRIKDVFFLAVECQAAARSAIIAEKCGNDAELRAEVESLVAAHQKLSHADESGGMRRTASLVEFQGNDRFALEAELGAGGFGVVYRAFDRKLGQWVALKVLHTPGGEGLVQFKREFRAIARLRLPNLVRCFELFSEQRSLFFTMELIDGVPLLDYLYSVSLADRATQAGDCRTAIFAQLTRGVLGLHAAGWLHRDLKPSNVLVDRTGRVVILDLGLARSVDDTHQSTRLFGSPYYIAPELFSRANATAASDWYSVGVMLYEALTGRAPWSSTWLDLVHEKTTAEPLPPRSLASDTPAHLDTLCLALLNRDPERRPSGTEVLRCLSQGMSPVSPEAFVEPRVVVPPFVGREEQMAVLRDAFARCADGRASVVEVTGQSGIGKTALVHHFLEALRQEQRNADSVVVLEGRCYERESLGYKVFDGVIDALGQYLKGLPSVQAKALLPRNLHQLAQVFPALLQADAVIRARRRLFAAREADGLELRRKAFDALRELLGRIAEKHPLVIFVDDLQWGDRDSSALLHSLLSAEDAPPLLLLVAYRTELTENLVLTDLRQALASNGAVHRQLLVEELGPQEAHRFAALLLGAQHPSIPAIVEEAGGIPYFLDELVGEARAEKAESTGAPRQELRLDRLLLERIDRLPPDAHHLLEVLSVARKPLPPETARAAAGLGADCDGALAMLYDSRLARPVGTGAFSEPHHDRIREVVETALLPSRRIDLHRRLALTLETQANGEAEQMAIHFRAAGDLERASLYAVAAAQEAVALAAFNRAVRLYQMAIELKGAGSADTADLLAKLGDAQANAGLGRKAADSYNAAANLDPVNGQELRRRAAGQLLRIGETDQGLSVMGQMLGSMRWRKADSVPTMVAWIVLRRALLRLRGLGFRPRPAHEVPQDLLLRTDLAWTAFLGLAVADPVRAAYIQSYHILDALKTREPSRIVRALAAEAVVAGMWGMGTRYQRLMEAAKRASNLGSVPNVRCWSNLARTVAVYSLGRWADCRKEAAATEQAFTEERTGASWELSIVRALGLAATMMTGEMRASQGRLQELLRDDEERGDFFAQACLALYGASFILRLAHDQPEVAEREYQDLRQHWPAARFPILENNAGVALANIALYMGRTEEAWSFFARGTPSSRRALLLASPILRIFYRHLHARAAIALALNNPAQRKVLLRIACTEVGALRAEKADSAVGFSQLIVAALASIRGDKRAAERALSEAENRLDSAGMRPFVMMARLVRGHLTPGGDGKVLVQEGESWAEQQGVRQPYRMTATFVPGIL